MSFLWESSFKLGCRVIEVIAIADETKMIIIEQARIVSMEEAGIYKIPTKRFVKNI